MRFLEIRRTGRTPQPADFDHDFPALIARTLSDLTPDERHVLRSVSLLDAFDLALATRAAGLTHQAPALRLTERPFVREDPSGCGPSTCTRLIRSTLRGADDQTDDRWSPRDWHQAAERALAALGEQWTRRSGADRLLLVGCLRQGLALARDFRLDLGWLAEAAWHYVSDSVWEPLAPPDQPGTEPGRAGDGRRRPGRTAQRPRPPPARAPRTHRRAPHHRHRHRPAARRPARDGPSTTWPRPSATSAAPPTPAAACSTSPTAAAASRPPPAAAWPTSPASPATSPPPSQTAQHPRLGRPPPPRRGRHLVGPRRHGPRGRRLRRSPRPRPNSTASPASAPSSRPMRALALAFTDPHRADDELDLAEQLLTGLDLRATAIDVRIAALVRDAGNPAPTWSTAPSVLRTEITVAGLTWRPSSCSSSPLAFHHAVRDEHDQLDETIDRLRDRAPGDDYAYYADIAHFMADQPLRTPSTRTGSTKMKRPSAAAGGPWSPPAATSPARHLAEQPPNCRGLPTSGSERLTACSSGRQPYLASRRGRSRSRRRGSQRKASKGPCRSCAVGPLSVRSHAATWTRSVPEL